MEDLKRSIAEDPKMMTVRPLLVNPDMVVFAGNQRLRACIDLGWEAVPCSVCDWTEEEQERAMIKDNGHHGEFDMEMMANGPHEPEQLQEWGVPIDWNKPEPEDEPKEPKQCKHCEKMIP